MDAAITGEQPRPERAKRRNRAETFIGRGGPCDRRRRNPLAALGQAASVGRARLRHIRRWPRGRRFGISDAVWRSEEHTSELQSLMRISYAVFCLKTKKH